MDAAKTTINHLRHPQHIKCRRPRDSSSSLLSSAASPGCGQQWHGWSLSSAVGERGGCSLASSTFRRATGANFPSDASEPTRKKTESMRGRLDGASVTVGNLGNGRRLYWYRRTGILYSIYPQHFSTRNTASLPRRLPCATRMPAQLLHRCSAHSQFPGTHMVTTRGLSCMRASSS